MRSVGVSCDIWPKRYKIFSNKFLFISILSLDNKYLFILKRDEQNQPIPIYYLMMGYDSLLGSHYDKYEVLYETYTTGPIDPKMFDIQDSFTCRSFPGPGHQNVALMNPIREFIHGDFDHIEHGFSNFTTKHNKSYVGPELTLRQSIFRHNYRFIMSHNRKTIGYKVAINHLADRSDDELRALRGKQRKATAFNGGLHFDKTSYDRSKVPSQWDWRLLGAVTPVKVRQDT